MKLSALAAGLAVSVSLANAYVGNMNALHSKYCANNPSSSALELTSSVC